ncbi:MAG: hypothetical protein E6996_15995, partial [Klebsiella michiganensis]|nr:hypothetical protein [Klebsiella michiganensis]
MLDIEQTQTNYVQSCLVLSARSEIPRTKYFCIKCFKIQLYEWYQLFFKTVSKNFARYMITDILANIDGLELRVPQGGFFVFCRCAGLIGR